MIKILQWLTRIAGLGALVLGLMLSRFPELPVHMAFGYVVVLALAVLALWALSARVRIPAAIAALLWAGATVYVGMMRNRGTAGEIIHVLLGIGAIGLAEMLGAAGYRTAIFDSLLIGHRYPPVCGGFPALAPTPRARPRCEASRALGRWN